MDYIELINNLVMWAAIVFIVKIIFSYLSFRKECDIMLEKFKYKIDNFEDIMAEEQKTINDDLGIYDSRFSNYPYWFKTTKIMPANTDTATDTDKNVDTVPLKSDAKNQDKDPEDKIFNF